MKPFTPMGPRAWFWDEPCPKNRSRTMIKTMMNEANIRGNFTNDSIHTTGTTAWYVCATLLTLRNKVSYFLASFTTLHLSFHKINQLLNHWMAQIVLLPKIRRCDLSLIISDRCWKWLTLVRKQCSSVAGSGMEVTISSGPSVSSIFF